MVGLGFGEQQAAAEPISRGGTTRCSEGNEISCSREPGEEPRPDGQGCTFGWGLSALLRSLQSHRGQGTALAPALASLQPSAPCPLAPDGCAAAGSPTSPHRGAAAPSPVPRGAG